MDVVNVATFTSMLVIEASDRTSQRSMDHKTERRFIGRSRHRRFVGQGIAKWDKEATMKILLQFPDQFEQSIRGIVQISGNCLKKTR